MATKPTLSQKFFAVLNRQLTEQGHQPIDPVEFSDPVVQPYSGTLYPGNTQIYLDPPLDSLVLSRVPVICNRLPLDDHTGIRIEKGAATSLLELLPQINDIFGLTFSMNDFVNTDVPADGGAMAIPASPTNLLFIGTLNITLV